MISRIASNHELECQDPSLLPFSRRSFGLTRIDPLCSELRIELQAVFSFFQGSHDSHSLKPLLDKPHHTRLFVAGNCLISEGPR